MNEPVADLARHFAQALEHLQGTWDLQYVGAEPVPVLAGDGAQPRDVPVSADPSLAPSVAAPPSSSSSSAPVTSSPPSSSSPSAPVTSSPPSSSSSSAPVMSSSPRGSAAAAPVTSSLSRGSSPAAPDTSPTSRGSSAAAPVTSSSPQDSSSAASVTSSTAPVTPAADPAPASSAQQAQAKEARKEALREQAQRWTPATKLEYLRRHNVGDCQRCPLARTRTTIVFGVGNPQADVMFVGEAPGADEDRQGEPFVGRSGRLLDQWLGQLGMKRDDVYIANVLKCRPPGNRDPKPEEVDRCSPFLQAQIRAIAPKVIVALGRHAGMMLSRREDMTLRAMRSTSRLQYDAGAPKGDPSAHLRIPLVVTYHPAYVLRQEGDGRSPPPGRSSPTELVLTDLRRALSIAGVGVVSDR